TVEAALAALDDVGLEGSTSEGHGDWSDTVEKGKVLGLKLPDGPVVPGDTLQLVLSKGVEQVAVPRIVGMSWPEARRALSDAGFNYQYWNNNTRQIAESPL